MADNPIPTSALIPVAFACTVVAILALVGAPEIILIPIAAITVGWMTVMLIRHRMNKKEP